MKMIKVKVENGFPKIDDRICSYQTSEIRQEIREYSEVNKEFYLPKKYSYTITKVNGFAKIFLINGEINHCSKCGNDRMEVEFKPVETKIYWSEHNEIKDIKQFTRNDRFYSSDRVNKECLVYKCDACGFKKAVKPKH